MSSDFEDELRRALKRVEPPDRFVKRVMRELPPKRGNSRIWVGAVAAGLVVLFTFGEVEQSRREHRLQLEQTQRQVAFALSLTAEKLDHALSQANVRLQRSAPDVIIEHDLGGRL